MARKIFISFQHDDRMRAKGFNLLRWNKNVDVEFVGRHLLDPVDSERPEYIRAKISEQLNGTSVTVVLIGQKAWDSDWVKYEIERSLEKGNGLLGIRLEPGVTVPQALIDSGAEVIDWNPDEFQAALDRAALAAKRTAAISAAGNTSGGCSR